MHCYSAVLLLLCATLAQHSAVAYRSSVYRKHHTPFAVLLHLRVLVKYFKTIFRHFIFKEKVVHQLKLKVKFI